MIAGAAAGNSPAFQPNGGAASRLETNTGPARGRPSDGCSLYYQFCASTIERAAIERGEGIRDRVGWLGEMFRRCYAPSGDHPESAAEGSSPRPRALEGDGGG